MLEQIIVSQIIGHLDKYSNLHKNQHGFRAKRSRLLMTTDDIAKQLNQGNQEDMGILDYSTAFVFEKVPHIRPSQKMCYYGIQRTTQTWTTYFLKDRQYMYFQNTASKWNASATIWQQLWQYYESYICHHFQLIPRLLSCIAVTDRPDFAASLTDSVPARNFSPSTNCLMRYLVRSINFPSPLQ